MNRQRLFILVGLGGLLALAGAGAASAATTPQKGGNTEGEGEGVPPPPPPPPETPPASTPNHGPVPNSSDHAKLDGFFGDSAGIARGLYMLGFGSSAKELATAITKGGRIAAVVEFQKAYDALADAGRAGKVGGLGLGKIPGDLGNMRRSIKKNGQYDGIVGYETLAALYNSLLYFFKANWSGAIWQVAGDQPISARMDMRAFLRSL